MTTTYALTSARVNELYDEFVNSLVTPELHDGVVRYARFHSDVHAHTDEIRELLRSTEYGDDNENSWRQAMFNNRGSQWASEGTATKLLALGYAVNLVQQVDPPYIVPLREKPWYRVYL